MEERDDERQEEMEAHLWNWDLRELMAAVEDVQETTCDALVLSRATRLYHKILEQDDEEETKPSPNSPAKTLEDLRKEMAGMESDLKSEGADGGSKERKSASSGNNLSGKGWALWEGPWVPKPIGVV